MYPSPPHHLQIRQHQPPPPPSQRPQPSQVQSIQQSQQQQQQSQPQPKTRPSASCIPCRNRKVKCNRSHPCSTCLTRSHPEECHYTASETDREAMKNAELIASLRSKIKGLKTRVDALPVDGFGAGAGFNGAGLGGDVDGFNGEGREEGQVYMALKEDSMETVDGIVKLIRAGVDMKEVVFFINSQRQMH